MKKHWLVLPVVWLVAGCSNNITMPWDVNMLDPGRVQTREPLEMPPDLNVLPTPDNPSGEALPQAKAPPAQSANAILFNSSPRPVVSKPLPGRNQKESLPGWMGNKGAQ
ncbi:MAG: DUF3035 domain-containing protein [Magnetococcales bacterium]|nr:DUF3035 domain-containing protein [Magnetococcales bacterium]